MNKLDNILRLGYQFKLSKNESQIVTGSIVKPATREEKVLSKEEMKGIYHSSIIDTNLSSQNHLLVSYYDETASFEAKFKRNVDDKTMLLAEGSSYSEVMNKMSNWIIWFYQDYAAISAEIDEKLNSGYNLVLTGETKGFVKKRIGNKPLIKLQDKSFFSMFETVSYELAHDDNKFLKVGKSEDKYVLAAYDLKKLDPNVSVITNDLLDGFATVDRNMRMEKGKVLCKKRY